ELHCAECHYRVAPTNKDQQKRCPECNTDWAGAGGLIVGRRPPTTPTDIVRIVAAVAALMLVIVQIFSPSNSISRMFPTSLLMGQVTSGRGYVGFDWTELARRSLTDQQRLDL